jgi:hypothetical protein
MAASGRHVFVRHGSRSGDWLRGFPVGSRGTEWGLQLERNANDTYVPLAATRALVFYARGPHVFASEAADGRQRPVATLPQQSRMVPDVTGLLSVDPARLVATDAEGGVSLLRPFGGGKGVRWRTLLPGMPDPDEPSYLRRTDLGAPVYDAKLDAVVVCAMDGRAFRIDAGTGAVRWTSQPREELGQLPGAPAVLHNRLGSFVLYPSPDCGVYLADADSGATLDSFHLRDPPEVALYTLPHEPTVLLPMGGVTAFEVVR